MSGMRRGGGADPEGHCWHALLSDRHKGWRRKLVQSARQGPACCIVQRSVQQDLARVPGPMDMQEHCSRQDRGKLGARQSSRRLGARQDSRRPDARQQADLRHGKEGP